jgi:hypothetical protein
VGKIKLVRNTPAISAAAYRRLGICIRLFSSAFLGTVDHKGANLSPDFERDYYERNIKYSSKKEVED